MAFDRLDPDKTAPFTLGPEEGAPVLLVHGFTGSPWDMRPLGEALAAGGFRVRGVRLPGHGTTPEALLRVRHTDWTLAVEDALLAERRRAGGRPVSVAGLSMGALLAAQVAARQPEAVAALALLAPALALQGPRMALARALTRAGLLERLWPWLRKDSTDIEDAAARAAAPVLHAIPAARLHDLFTLQRLAPAALARVRCPALVVSATGDHVVTAGSAEQAARLLERAGAPGVRRVVLTRGFHILPRDTDRERLAEAVAAFFRAPTAAPTRAGPSGPAPSPPAPPAAGGDPGEEPLPPAGGQVLPLRQGG